MADIHYLLPKYKLQIYAEHYQKVEHCLLCKNEAEFKDIKYVKKMNYKKNDLNKMKKNNILEIIKTKTNISIIGKNTKSILIQKLLEFQKQQNPKEQKSNTLSREKQKNPKKKRGRRAKSELNIESIMAQKNTFKENKNVDPNIIVHLSGVTLDNIKEFKKNNNPLKYNPVVNIPKETSSIKETNFAWINKKTKTPITSFSFLTKKNQKDSKQR